MTDRLQEQGADISTIMVVKEEDVVNIMGGMENTGGIKLNDHKRKLKNRWAFNPFGRQL
jgi:hypothetical protein